MRGGCRCGRLCQQQARAARGTLSAFPVRAPPGAVHARRLMATPPPILSFKSFSSPSTATLLGAIMRSENWQVSLLFLSLISMACHGPVSLPVLAWRQAAEPFPGSPLAALLLIMRFSASPRIRRLSIASAQRASSPVERTHFQDDASSRSSTS